LSGGQRKLLLFELIYQRTAKLNDLLLVLDEPFAGVTDDFVPWIVGRLDLMRQRHNILLVTNDHVDTLKRMADNTIVVSAIDRSNVQVNGMNSVNRDKAILALSMGDDYVYKGSVVDDVKFFLNVEVVRNGGLIGVGVFTTIVFLLFLATFWDSNPSQAALIYSASSIVAFFSINPYLLTLADWRNYMGEEAEALLHSSKSNNKVMKSILTLILMLIVSLFEWGFVNAVVDSFRGGELFVGMMMDILSLISPFLFFGLYTKLPFEAVEIASLLPFMFMIFFSTTFSPGSGVKGLKELRYLFTRFYFYCSIPGVQDTMEGCPDSDLNILYLILSGFIFTVMFFTYKVIKFTLKSVSQKKDVTLKNKLKDNEFRDLQVELYGEGVFLKYNLSETNRSTSSSVPKNIVPQIDEEEFA
jgi:hypothetical protein